MVRKVKIRHAAIAFTVTLFVLVFSVFFANPTVTRLELLTQDMYYSIRGPEMPGNDVVIAAIDETRDPQYPKIPTFKEMGGNASATTLQIVYAPKNLPAAVRAKLNLVVAGGTNTGKTTMLRCLLNEVPPEERVVTVEDNLEIGLDRFLDLHPDQVMWERRGANIEGHGEAVTGGGEHVPAVAGDCLA